MTENKRFTIKEIDNFNYGIKVTDVIIDDGIELPQSTVCDLLNGYDKENEQLKKENKELQGKASSWKITASEQIMEQSKLIKENGQLKERIKELEKEVNNLSCGEADWLIEEEL